MHSIDTNNGDFAKDGMREEEKKKSTKVDCDDFFSLLHSKRFPVGDTSIYGKCSRKQITQLRPTT